MDGRVDKVALAWLAMMRPDFDATKAHEDPRQAIVVDEARGMAMGFLAMFDAAHTCCAEPAAATVVANKEQPAAKWKSRRAVDPAETGSVDVADAGVPADSATQE